MKIFRRFRPFRPVKRPGGPVLPACLIVLGLVLVLLSMPGWVLLSIIGMGLIMLGVFLFLRCC